MNSSFYNSVSGVKSYQFAMDVQANNISNINTIGFKGSNPEIASHFAATLAGTFASFSNDVAFGSHAQTTAFNMNQGVLQNTDNAFDLAIQGEGWFGVQGQNKKNYYTRAGQFAIDAQGNLTDSNGNYLLATLGNNIIPTTVNAATMAKFGTYYKGTTQAPATPFAVKPMGDVPLGSIGGQTKVTLPDFLYYPPIATSKVSYAANLEPTVKTDAVTVPLNAADYTATIRSTAFASLNGTVSNTAAVTNPQPGDPVTITLTDVDGKTQTISTTLDASLNWSIANADVSGLNNTSNLTASVSTTYTPASVPLNAADYVSTVIPTPTATASISGTTSNTPALSSAQAGDTISVTFTDVHGNKQTITTTLDASKNWSITNADVSTLDTSSNLTASVEATYAPTTVALSTTDYTAAVTPTGLGKVNLSGTTSNTTALQNPKQGDTVFITFTDSNGKTLTTTALLDASKNWTLSNYDVSSLNTSSALTASVSVKSVQEIPNVEHLSTGIIGPDGDKDILDMTFTKRVPQGTSGTTWDADVKILSYFEDYKIEQYDPSKTYDPSIYNVNTTAHTVTKIYDPTKYYVNTTDKKVYEIVDQKTGVLTFGGAGQLLSNSIGTLSNGGTPLELNLGTIGNYDGLISSTTIKKGNSASANGSVEGFLKGYGMDGNGNIVAEFSNGKSSAIAKVAIYHFQNDQGLNPASSNLFEESANSGKAIFYTDKNGQSTLGSKILNYKLEGSNVSMATALTELIVVQKAFTASAKGITTSDELLQNAINMKR